MKVQTAVSDPVTEQKLKEMKVALEKETGLRVSWAAFFNKVIRDWVIYKDKENVRKTSA